MLVCGAHSKKNSQVLQVHGASGQRNETQGQDGKLLAPADEKVLSPFVELVQVVLVGFRKRDEVVDELHVGQVGQYARNE